MDCHKLGVKDVQRFSSEILPSFLEWTQTMQQKQVAEILIVVFGKLIPIWFQQFYEEESMKFMDSANIVKYICT